MHAPTATTRLNTLKSLTAGGIETYAFLGPLLPYYVQWPEKLECLIERLSEAGVRSVYVEHLNPSRYISQRVEQEMKKYAPSKANALRKSEAMSAQSTLEKLIFPLLQYYEIRLRMEKAIVYS